MNFWKGDFIHWKYNMSWKVKGGREVVWKSCVKENDRNMYWEWGKSWNWIFKFKYVCYLAKEMKEFFHLMQTRQWKNLDMNGGVWKMLESFTLRSIEKVHSNPWTKKPFILEIKTEKSSLLKMKCKYFHVHKLIERHKENGRKK